MVDYFCINDNHGVSSWKYFAASSTNPSGLKGYTVRTYNMIAMVLVMIVFGPIMEEIIMQYFIQRLLQRSIEFKEVKPVWASIIAIIIATIILCYFIWII